MKIFFLFPYVPYPLTCGAYQRSFHLLRELSEKHETYLFALSTSPGDFKYLDFFQNFCTKVQFFPFEHPLWGNCFSQIFCRIPTTVKHWQRSEVYKELEKFSEDFRFDLLHVQDLVLLPYAQRIFPRTPVVLDRARLDLFFYLQGEKYKNGSVARKASRWQNIFKVFLFEKHASKTVAHSVVCCQEDAQFFRKRISPSAPVSVIPNGVDLSFFDCSLLPGIQENLDTLTFVGSMDYLPNVDGISWFFKEIFPIVKACVSGLKVFIVGGNPTKEVQGYGLWPGVTVTGLVEDVRPYYLQGAIFIAPIRIGGGSRLKIVEAMALNRAVVSTKVGCEGLAVTDEEDVLLGDDGENFARHIIRLLGDSSFRRRVAKKGQELVQQRYSWPALAHQYDTVYSSL